MSEYLRLQAQIIDLQKQAAAIRDTEKQAAIASIDELIRTFGIAPQELHFIQSAEEGAGARRLGRRSKKATASLTVDRKRHPSAGTTIAPRFRDANGNIWTGRGVQPVWLRQAIASGETLESFRIG